MSKFPPIVSFNEVAEAGYPDIVAPVIFLPFCNLRCPYCLNADVVFNKLPVKMGFNDVLQYLKENEEEYIAISGGEPCMHGGLKSMIKAFRDEGFKVSLSTNGYQYKKLKTLVEEGLVQYVAMDVKTDLDNFELLSSYMPAVGQVENIKKSIEFLKSVKSNLPNLDFNFEFRTTMYPPMVNAETIEKIGLMLDSECVWILQQFRPREGLLAEEAGSVDPYSDEQIEVFQKAAKKYVPKTFLRWP